MCASFSCQFLAVSVPITVLEMQLISKFRPASVRLKPPPNLNSPLQVVFKSYNRLEGCF